MQTAIALALIRPGNISERRTLGTGPAPSANVRTNLHFQVCCLAEFAMHMHDKSIASKCIHCRAFKKLT